MTHSKHVGSSLDSWLEEEGLSADAEAVATKRIIAFQLADLMEKRALTKVELARRMKTSRAALDRLLDPENASVTLQTLQRAAIAIGGKLTIPLEF